MYSRLLIALEKDTLIFHVKKLSIRKKENVASNGIINLKIKI